ncbi:MAG TPA: RNA-binding S4 domain-containing protein [Terriglobales bacterium]|nr:RNA-binding S4 domain-containing protein [Terriglobales bacterium]
MRMDKWLWAARFFKTRALAAHACELGRVLLAAQPAKPSREVRVGDHLRITTTAGIFEIEVQALSEVRGPASAAQKLYQESDDSRAARARESEIRRLNWQPSADTPGRPTKRDRRQISRLRGR